MTSAKSNHERRVRRGRRPIAVYRVLDEDDLLHGTDFLGSGEPVDPPPAPRPAGRPVRRRVLLAGAGTLVVALLVARLAIHLLAGAGVIRSPRHAIGRGSLSIAAVPSAPASIRPAAVSVIGVPVHPRYPAPLGARVSGKERPLISQ